MSRSFGQKSLTIADIGAALVRCQIVQAEQWQAALTSVAADPQSAEIEPVLKHLASKRAWWTTENEPTLSSYQMELVREAFRHRRRPALSSFRLSNYILLDQLGAGGMAKVYRAHDLEHKRIVAVKRVGHANKESRLRFKRESKILQGLRHPGINRFFSCHILKESALLVVEYIEGQSLAAVGKNVGGPMDWRTAANYMIQCVEALAFAHERGVLHRDIKPHNMQIAKRSGLLVLLDFGLAKVRSESEEDWEESLAEQTQGDDGREIGTPYYMSPEHWHGSKHVEEASDVYSLGCVFYELLAGRAPFRGARPVVIKGHCMSPRPSIREYSNDVPADLELMVQCMMAIRSADRPSLSLIRTQLKKIMSRRKLVSQQEHEASGHPGPGRVLSTASIQLADNTSAEVSQTIAKLLEPSDTPAWVWRTLSFVLSMPLRAMAWVVLLTGAAAFGYFAFRGQG